jgi:hypothetical protein
MSDQDAARAVDLHLARTELQIVRTALRHLLASEDDAETIEEIKVILARLPRPGEVEAGEAVPRRQAVAASATTPGGRPDS